MQKKILGELISSPQTESQNTKKYIETKYIHRQESLISSKNAKPSRSGSAPVIQMTKEHALQVAVA